mmetsp:Transcript_28689/g.56357  ORF Transcript_28689/g.56357 Transcript_28689/m.56357 type:complete len:95 (+) Transcript_28689:488-772(+)
MKCDPRVVRLLYVEAAHAFRYCQDSLFASQVAYLFVKVNGLRAIYKPGISKPGCSLTVEETVWGAEGQLLCHLRPLQEENVPEFSTLLREPSGC